MTPDFVHRFIPGTAVPVLLLLHGTGGTEDDLIPIGQELFPSAAILSPRGQILENGMPRFFRRFSEGVFDLEDLARRTRELAAFIDAAAEKYDFDAGSIVPVGYSNGANIATSLILSGEKRFPAAVLFRAMVPFVPTSRLNLQGSSILVAAGRFDPIVPESEAKRLSELFERAGAQVTLRVEDAGHELLSAEIQGARNWLRQLFPVP